jgi:hypothetical protein
MPKFYSENTNLIAPRIIVGNPTSDHDGSRTAGRNSEISAAQYQWNGGKFVLVKRHGGGAVWGGAWVCTEQRMKLPDGFRSTLTTRASSLTQRTKARLVSS